MFLLQVGVLNAEQPSLIQSTITFFTTSAFVLRVFYFLKIILIIYTVILFVATVLVIINARPKKKIREVEEEAIESILARGAVPKEKEEGVGVDRWEAITQMIESKEESGWRLAVIEADKFFDEVMRRLGYSGDNFGERLKQMHPTEVTNLNDIWDAHRIRNSISHDVGFKLSQDDARRVVEIYATAMRDLDVM